MTGHRCGASALAVLAVFGLSGCAAATRGGPGGPGKPWSYVTSSLKDDWAYDRIKSKDAHAKFTGKGTTIAVLDTGVLAGHEDLDANVKPGVLKCVGASSAEDKNGHGTQLVGIVGGKKEKVGNATRGIAPDATVIPVKIDCGVVTTKSLRDGLDAATAGKDRPDVVLLALGGYPPDGLANLKDHVAANTDILFVIASIWDVASISDAQLAWTRGPNVIAVAATTLDDAAMKEIPYRDDRSGELWAPGRDVETADIEPDPDPKKTTHAEYKMQGTSAAAAMTAGCAALIREQKGTITASDLKKAIIDEFAEPLSKPIDKRLRCFK